MILDDPFLPAQLELRHDVRLVEVGDDGEVVETERLGEERRRGEERPTLGVDGAESGGDRPGEVLGELGADVVADQVGGVGAELQASRRVQRAEAREQVERVATRGLHQQSVEPCRWPGQTQAANQCVDLDAVQSGHRDDRCRAGTLRPLDDGPCCRSELEVTIRNDDEEPLPSALTVELRDAGNQPAEQIDRCVVGPVHVLDREHQRLRPCELGDEGKRPSLYRCDVGRQRYGRLRFESLQQLLRQLAGHSSLAESLQDGSQDEVGPLLIQVTRDLNETRHFLQAGEELVEQTCLSESRLCGDQHEPCPRRFSFGKARS